MENPSLTGVKFSRFLIIFHVTENFSVDIAHDIFEGVGHSVMALILHQFVMVEHFFSIETLNHKLTYFTFSRNHNKPPLITIDNLKKKN